MNQKAKQIESEARRVAEGGEADQQSQRQGNNRAPNKTTDRVKYADNEGGGEQKNQRGSTRTSLKPEQQRG
jgi:hypothetical protein